MKARVFDRKGRNDHIENFFKPYALLTMLESFCGLRKFTTSSI